MPAWRHCRMLVQALLVFAAPALCAAADALPEAAVYLPAPPAPGSPLFQGDEAQYAATRAFRGTPRWEQATRDADESQRATSEEWFREAFGMPIDARTPHTAALVLLARQAIADGTTACKKRYMRTRPFVFHKADGQTCAPQAEERLRHDGSYPSGHACAGWTLALILAQISPERQDALLRRGYEIGQSRVICGFHWQSDVDAGRVTGSALVSRLSADPAYQRTLAAAREEIRALRAAR